MRDMFEALRNGSWERGFVTEVTFLMFRGMLTNITRAQTNFIVWACDPTYEV